MSGTTGSYPKILTRDDLKNAWLNGKEISWFEKQKDKSFQNILRMSRGKEDQLTFRILLSFMTPLQQATVAIFAAEELIGLCGGASKRILHLAGLCLKNPTAENIKFCEEALSGHSDISRPHDHPRSNAVRSVRHATSAACSINGETHSNQMPDAMSHALSAIKSALLACAMEERLIAYGVGILEGKMNPRSMTGTVKAIGGVQELKGNFRKRELILSSNEDGSSQDICFEFLQDDTSLLDKIEVGMEVGINFEIRGRESNGRYYNTLAGVSLEGKSAESQESRAPVNEGLNNSLSVTRNPFYNENADMDQQSIEFWDSL